MFSKLIERFLLKKKEMILARKIKKNPEFNFDSFLQNNFYGFELTLNPTKREKITGKTIPIRGKDNLLSWFTNKAPTHGFEIVGESLRVQSVGVQRFEKEGSVCTHGTATFIGKLKVTNREIFIKSFKQGIGRAKAFGFGLLQIVPLHS